MQLGDKTFSFAERLQKIEDEERIQNQNNAKFKNSNGSNNENILGDSGGGTPQRPPQFLKKKFIEDSNENNMVMKCKFLKATLMLEFSERLRRGGIRFGPSQR